MRFQVRKRNGSWEAWTLPVGGRSWQLAKSFPTFWQAMLHVTGVLPYRDETGWTPGLRPLWV